MRLQTHLTDRRLGCAQAYEGPALVPRMKRELLACLEADGFESVQAAIAADHRPPRPP